MMPQLMVAMPPTFNMSWLEIMGVLYNPTYIKLHTYSDMKPWDFTGSCLHRYSSVRYSSMYYEPLVSSCTQSFVI